MEASEAFGNEAEPAQETQEAPEAAQDEAAPDATPDLSEQEQALAAKVAAQVAESLQNQPDEQEPEDDTPFFDALYGEDDEGEDEGFYEDEEQEGPEGQEEQPDPVLQHPAVQQLIQSHQQTIGYLAAREEQANRDKINDFAQKNPEINQPAVKSAVFDAVEAIAQATQNENARTNPEVVRMAFNAVMFEKNRSQGTPSQEARTQGAPVETAAGAAVETEADSFDDEWERIKNKTGGNPFG
jgi:hypothetical protein